MDRVSREARSSALERLKAAKEGKLKLTDVVQDEEDDAAGQGDFPMTEEERQDGAAAAFRDDFVVDDNGLGYSEAAALQEQDLAEEAGEAGAQANKKPDIFRSRARARAALKKTQVEGGNSLISRQDTVSRPARLDVVVEEPAAGAAADADEDEGDDAMADLLNQLDDGDDDEAAPGLDIVPNGEAAAARRASAGVAAAGGAAAAAGGATATASGYSLPTKAAPRMPKPSFGVSTGGLAPSKAASMKAAAAKSVVKKETTLNPNSGAPLPAFNPLVAASAGRAAGADAATLPRDLPLRRCRFPKDAPRGAASDVVKSARRRLTGAPPATLLELASATGVEMGPQEAVLHVFWLDIYEEPRAPGKLYLFGKVFVQETKAWASVCVTLTNLQRCMFVLPRTQDVNGNAVQMADVRAELVQLLGRHGIKQVRSKPVMRKYAFELPDVPREETEYLKVVYPAEKAALNPELSGRTFSRVFGGATSATEHFLLKRGIMGPCWLELRGVKASPMKPSHCKYNLVVENPKNVNPLTNISWSLAEGRGLLPPAPPLRVLSLALKTTVNPQTQRHEVVAVSGFMHDSVSMDAPTEMSAANTSRFTFMRPPNNCAWPADMKATPDVQLMSNERALLSRLLGKIAQLDPDCLLGHNISGFDLDVLLHRIRDLKVGNWSLIGRMRRSRMPSAKPGPGGRDTFLGDTTAGRLLCDTKLVARELMFKQTSFALDFMAKQMLGQDRVDVKPETIPSFFWRKDNPTLNQQVTAQRTMWLAQHTVNDAWIALALGFRLQVLPLTKQLTNLAGNRWSRSLKGARAERIEYLLLHTFHDLKYVTPDKFHPHPELPADGRIPSQSVVFDHNARFEKNDKGKKRGRGAAAGAGGDGGNGVSGTAGRKRGKPKYQGGMVLEPKKGLYERYVLLLDFNSLYPSIIQEYNICFTTVQRFDPKTEFAALQSRVPPSERQALPEEEEGEEEEAYIPPVPPRPAGSDKSSMATLPSVIRSLVEKRRAVKRDLKQAKDPVVKQQLDIRQKALKILANSMYGCLGFKQSRFYAQPLAALVTLQGREILMNTKELAEKELNLEVIYGDTDSIMLYTNSTDYDAVMKLGLQAKQAVNKRYRLLEIDIDGVYARMLLLKKKKYAALMVERSDKLDPETGKPQLVYEKEMKGLDLVRRDWCVLSRTVGEDCLTSILSGKPTEEVLEEVHGKLEVVGQRARAGGYDLAQYVITKALNKAPQDYPDAKGQPHLAVALRMIKHNISVNVGDVIPYVVCNEVQTDDAGNPSTPTKRASSNSHSSLADRVYHPDEVKASNGTLVPDIEYYLGHQLLPPLTRLVEPIDGTSRQRIAECLGLDPTRFSNPTTAALGLDTHDEEGMVPQATLDDAERFRLADPIPCQCPRCGHRCLFPGLAHDDPLVGAGDAAASATGAGKCGVQCPNPACAGLLCAEFGAVMTDSISAAAAARLARAAGGVQTPEKTPQGKTPGSGSSAVGGSPGQGLIAGLHLPAMPEAQVGAGRDPVTGEEIAECRMSLVNAVASLARRRVTQHNAGWLVCDEPCCGLRTRCQMTAKHGYSCLRPGCHGRMWPESPFAKLHNQLEYYEALFDRVRAKAIRSEAGKEVVIIPGELTNIYDAALDEVQELLRMSAYHYVSCDSLFRHVEASNGPAAGSPSKRRRPGVRQ